MHTTLIGSLLLGAIAVVMMYMLLTGPRTLSEEERNSAALYALSLVMMFAVVAAMVVAIIIALYLIVHGLPAGMI